jgi:hypothetical protein
METEEKHNNVGAAQKRMTAVAQLDFKVVAFPPIECLYNVIGRHATAALSPISPGSYVKQARKSMKPCATGSILALGQGGF